MAKYKLSDNGVFDTEREAWIPEDIGNYDWVVYQDWVDAGNTADPQYTEQELLDIAWGDLRGERTTLLQATDFMMLTDVNSNYTTTEQNELTTYRQELRDLPDNTTDPNDITWPTKPQIVIDAGI